MPSTVRAHDRRERQHGSGSLAGDAAGAGLIALADGELIALDKDGSLALTRDRSQGFDVRSQVAPENCLDTDDAVRTKLYVRDHASVVVPDLDA
jgi:hypothetical protein